MPVELEGKLFDGDSKIAEKIPVAPEKPGIEEFHRLGAKPFSFYSYPSDGSKKTVGVGVTQIDFYTGKVVLPDGTEEHISDNLKHHKAPYIRSFSLDVDQDVIIWTEDQGKRPIEGREVHSENYQNITILYIKTTVSTQFSIWASTHPEAGSVGILGEKIKITDGTSEVDIDPDTKSIHFIDGEHMKFHAGQRFRTCIGYPAVADDGSAHLLIHVGSMQIHPTLALSAEGMAHGRIFEGANPSYLGTENLIYDMNRSTKNTPEARAYHTLGLGTLGTMIACTLVPGGTGPKSIGGINRLDTAWLLGSLTNYVIEIVNKGGAAKEMQIEVEFLEY